MNNFKEEQIIKDIGKKRYSHSLNVMEMALKLSEIYNADNEKVKIAAKFHDCGKIRDKTKLLEMAGEFDIILDQCMEHNIELIHGPLGAKIAKERYKIRDKEVLNAIKYHTTARENMTLLDKIIYISDYIEPGRKFPGVEEVRELAFKDIDKSIIMAMDKTINFLIDNKNLIHTETIKARNYLIINDNKTGGV